MQPGSPPVHPTIRIMDQAPVHQDEPLHLPCVDHLPAADAGPTWRAHCWGETSASERMSIRHPVRRAASRAFCPSRPIARDSW